MSAELIAIVRLCGCRYARRRRLRDDHERSFVRLVRRVRRTIVCSSFVQGELFVVFYHHQPTNGATLTLSRALQATFDEPYIIEGTKNRVAAIRAAA
jgi:hypothetical protein